MSREITRRVVAIIIAVLIVGMAGQRMAAQVTTGTIAGSVKDTQGGAIPGATVLLISQSRGTTTESRTNETGDFVIPNVMGDTYTLKVQMDGFKTLERQDVRVSGGDRLSTGPLIIEVGALAETVIVTGDAPMIQARSGERSYTVTTESVSNLPVSTSRNFASLASLAPGVVGTTRLGSTVQNNFQIDGISTMDTGNNGQMLQTNVEAIAEVKIITQGFAAEYGRSAGMQISGVTKSGSNQFRGSVYDIQRHSRWDSNSWANVRNGVAKSLSDQHDRGYTIGGPIGKPGGSNKLFFFYAHEYRPRTGGGGVSRFRVPTALERAGDFSQSTDNNGNPANLIKDPLSSQACTAANNAGCFQDGGVLGRIPANRLDPNGLAVLNLWPLPNTSALNFNYSSTAPTDERLTQQPTIRVDYNVTNTLRVTGKYTGQRATVKPSVGSIPGFNDSFQPFPFITNYSTTVDWTVSNNTFMEGNYGMIRNQLGSPLIGPKSSKVGAGLGSFPMIYPNAGVMDPRYYEYGAMVASGSPSFANGVLLTPPDFTWGSRISNAPPNLSYPAFLNLNRTQDVNISLTRLMGPHTMKAGFYSNHSIKAQNSTLSPFQGQVDFGNDTNNPLDTGFGFSNAAVGVFSSYTQGSKFIEGSYVYTNIEGYLQDNWKVSNKLTLDYGVRITHMSPLYDQFLQASMFFPDKWSASSASVLYVPGCPGNVNPCANSVRQAVNPLTGVSLGASSSAAIATIVPGTGSIVDGITVAGKDGLNKYAVNYPAVVFGPRIGAAYDVSGSQHLVLRGSAGLFFDRPDLGSSGGNIANPPITNTTTIRYGQLQSFSTGLATQGAPTITQNDFTSRIPKAWQWNAGAQFTLPFSLAADVSYVGNHTFDAYGSLASPSAPPRLYADINSVDLGAAYLPQNQDKTLAASTVPGATALPTDLLRPYQGVSAINLWQSNHWTTYHSIQSSLNRRLRNGFQVGLNYTLSLSTTGDFLTQPRLQHDANRGYSLRPDQAQQEELLSNMGNRPHIIKANFLWQAPKMAHSGTASTVLAQIVNDWQVSGIFTAGSGPTYDIGYTYNSNGANVNLTGSPTYAARTVINPGVDMGSGCSSNQYGQFNRAAFSGPTYGSLGLESGRNYLNSCSDHTLDLAVARNIRVGGSRMIQFRLDAFNVLNSVVFSNRQSTLQLNSPTDQTVRNAQYNADGSLNTTRLTPQTAGFGAVTAAQGMRALQGQLRFMF